MCSSDLDWRRLVVDADAAITTIPLSTSQTNDTIPGYVAVLAKEGAAELRP